MQSHADASHLEVLLQRLTASIRDTLGVLPIELENFEPDAIRLKSLFGEANHREIIAPRRQCATRLKTANNRNEK
jgi:hypothetical protein